MSSILKYRKGSVKTNQELYAELKELAIALYRGNDKPLETLKGEITGSDIISDHNFLMKLIEIYKKLSHIPANVTMIEFDRWSNELCRSPAKHNHKFFWIQWVFECRLTPIDKPSVVECVHNALVYRRNVVSIRRRTTLDMVYHYQEYLEGRTPAIDQRNKIDYIAAIKDVENSFFNQLKTNAAKKHDYIIVRAQYLFIEKVIKQRN